jgi:hypothetical protein
MQADYSLELGREDPALEIPWQSDDGTCRFLDLKRHPHLVLEISEAINSPELSAFLSRMNAPAFSLETAKCDVWHSQDISREEEIFGAEHKFVSYVDLIFAAEESRLSLEKHEALAKSLCRLLERAPEMAASVELVVRRCYYHSDPNPAASRESVSGFCLTTYVSGFGEDEPEARKCWSIALTLLQNALVQVAR